MRLDWIEDINWYVYRYYKYIHIYAYVQFCEDMYSATTKHVQTFQVCEMLALDTLFFASERSMFVCVSDYGVKYGKLPILSNSYGSIECLDILRCFLQDILDHLVWSRDIRWLPYSQCHLVPEKPGFPYKNSFPGVEKKNKKVQFPAAEGIHSLNPDKSQRPEIPSGKGCHVGVTMVTDVCEAVCQECKTTKCPNCHI